MKIVECDGNLIIRFYDANGKYITRMEYKDFNICDSYKALYESILTQFEDIIFDRHLSKKRKIC